jgi:hypothetical protein
MIDTKAVRSLLTSTETFVDGAEVELGKALRQCADEIDALKRAIEQCIAMANGRETEWGERAESAFEFLHEAIDRARKGTT